MCVHCIVHNCCAQCSAQNRPDDFPSHPPDNDHCSDVYLREGGSHPTSIWSPRWGHPIAISSRSWAIVPCCLHDPTFSHFDRTPRGRVSNINESQQLLSWSLTSLFSTNMAISETKWKSTTLPYKHIRDCDKMMTLNNHGVQQASRILWTVAGLSKSNCEGKPASARADLMALLTA